MRYLIGLMLPVFTLVAGDAPQPVPASLQQIHKVYLLPMGSSLDQYLANRLSTAGLFEVVTDPAKADAVFTEAVGEGLQDKLNELYLPPEAKKKDEDEDKKDDPFAKPSHRISGISRGRGTVFLVDRNTRTVLWSIYKPVRGSRPDDTNRRAGDIVKHLEKTIKGK